MNFNVPALENHMPDSLSEIQPYNIQGAPNVPNVEQIFGGWFGGGGPQEPLAPSVDWDEFAEKTIISIESGNISAERAAIEWNRLADTDFRKVNPAYRAAMDRLKAAYLEIIPGHAKNQDLYPTS